MASDHRWRFSRALFLSLFFFAVHHNLDFCLSLNGEAVALMKFKDRIEREPLGALLNWKGGEFDHCSWFDFKCSHGKVVILNNIRFGGSANRRLLQLGTPDGGVQASPLSPPPPPPEIATRIIPRPPPPEIAIPRPPPPRSASSPDTFKADVPNAASARSPPRPPEPHRTPPPPPPPPPVILRPSQGKRSPIAPIVGGVLGGVFFITILVIAIVFCWNQKVHIRPWAAGISGQLQKALVTGAPGLKLSELRTACEDFSNIIGSFSDGTIYKGTLSSGAEIAVASIAVRSPEDWSMELQTHFKEKIEMLSKVNHNNFLNLIGCCQEDEPFARMMVFEYAPNGTLAEHLHGQEAEHLDWKMRLRIAMGIAYCLEQMHQLTPPISHKNLDSSSVYLTEDNAAKIADLTFLNHITPAKEGSSSRELLELSSADPLGNVYSFGVILYEMITAKNPHSEVLDGHQDSVSPYLQGNRPIREIADPTLESFEEDVLERLLRVVQHCVHPDPTQRPTMREVVAKLREITGITPDGAMPRLSPSWWAELEIISSEAN